MNGVAPARGIRCAGVLVLALGGWVTTAGAAEGPPDWSVPASECLVLKLPQQRRAVVHVDPVEARLVGGAWTAPQADESVTLPDGKTEKWERVVAKEPGKFAHPAIESGYAYLVVHAAEDRVVLLHAQGHTMVYVNGVPRVGDVYGTGYVRVPVQLKRGANELLFLCQRGELQVELLPPDAPVMFNAADVTLPDLITERGQELLGAIAVINATPEWLSELHLDARLNPETSYALSAGALSEPTASGVLSLLMPQASIPPLGIRKLCFCIPGYVAYQTGSLDLKLELSARQEHGGKPLATTVVKLGLVRPKDRRRETFTSGIDDSVQYYAVTPMAGAADAPARPALFLTLHGASVEASGQAAAYAAKDWGHIVAPTNRRPFGFDWEDWGRIDALEVLSRAAETLGTDPRRTYLTGHSMGGHGVWQLGATYPDRFAAIAPSAGWISFWSYTKAARPEGETPVARLLQRVTAPSDTLTLSRNYLHHGVYILHGEADDNVPVEQARTMRAHLGGFHPDFAYHERPGAGHWWGNECVDWPPLFDFLRYHTRPAPHEVRHVEFVTVNPGVSAACDWASIEAQVRQLSPSSVVLDFDPAARKFVGKTDNVARLALDLTELSRVRPGVGPDAPPAAVLPPGKPVAVELDGQPLPELPWPTGEPRLWLAFADGHWSAGEEPASDLKGPRRYGMFKSAFGNRMAFVYGTRGTEEEQRWALAKARYDAETFWYRGNGSVDLVADTAFKSATEPERNVILYGNADTNTAWAELLAASPVTVTGGQVRIGTRVLEGDALACLLVRPRPGSAMALVGAVAGTSVRGMRLTERLPVFSSGVAWPDCVVLSSAVLEKGIDGIEAAGFFGLNWSVESGEFAWRE